MGFLSSVGKVFKKVGKGLVGAVKGVGSVLTGGGGLGTILGGLTSMIPGVGPFLAPLVTGLGGFVGDNFGSIASGVGGYLGQQQTNEQNSALALRQMQFQDDQAKRQMAFQERMRNSAYQAATDDMYKAGINPILAYKQGGAAVPGGASGSGASAVMSNPVSSALQAFNSTANTALSMKLNRAQVNQAEEQVRKMSVEREVSAQTIDRMQDEQNLLRSQESYYKKLGEKVDQETNSAQMNNQVKAGYLKAQKKKGKIKSETPTLQYLDVLLDSIGRILGAGNSANKLFMSK